MGDAGKDAIGPADSTLARNFSINVEVTYVAGDASIVIGDSASSVTTTEKAIMIAFTSPCLINASTIALSPASSLLPKLALPSKRVPYSLIEVKVPPH